MDMGTLSSGFTQNGSCFATGGLARRIQSSLGVSDSLYATVLVEEKLWLMIAVVDCDLDAFVSDYTQKSPVRIKRTRPVAEKPDSGLANNH